MGDVFVNKKAKPYDFVGAILMLAFALYVLTGAYYLLSPIFLILAIIVSIFLFKGRMWARIVGMFIFMIAIVREIIVFSALGRLLRALDGTNVGFFAHLYTYFGLIMGILSAVGLIALIIGIVITVRSKNLQE